MPSPSNLATDRSEVVILGTGGTIAGRAASATDNVGYRAGAASVDDLVAAVPALAGQRLTAEGVAQIDSKDMDAATWQRLAKRCRHHLARDAVAGIVITHGTDTLEETAWFMHRVLAPAKPVVLTAAMRPATSLQADGPQNLLDAVTLARQQDARGVLVAFAGQVHGAQDVQKMHGYRIDAFASPNAGAIGFIEEGRLRRVREWPLGEALAPACWAGDVGGWPFVVLVTSHAAADARVVDALVQAGARGVVVAGTGNATVHHTLDAALRRAAAAGVVVRRASRCALGTPVAAAAAAAGAGSDAWPFYPGLNPVKARVELLLELLQQQPTRLTPT